MSELGHKIRSEHTNSRRFSASNSMNFIENENVTISSTVSYPGYSIKDEIDPAKYSFTSALKALQARRVYSWEYISSSDGITLNSKWNDAEKYICNPLSGQVPLECLSAKTLSSRSLSARITVSVPLVYPSRLRLIHPKYPIIEHDHHLKFPAQEKKKSGTRDVGIQSTQGEFSSESSYSPSTEETSTKLSEEGTADSSVSTGKQISEPQVGIEWSLEHVLYLVHTYSFHKVEVRERKEGRGRKKVMIYEQDGRRRRIGCGLSFKGLWQCRTRDNNNTYSSPTFHYHINDSFNQ